MADHKEAIDAANPVWRVGAAPERLLALPLALMFVLAACGGSGGSGTGDENDSGTRTCAGQTIPAGVEPDLVVWASGGDDVTGTGSCVAPYKTITRALTEVSAGQIVWVAPGVYDAALGELFPLAIPAEVTLVGDPENLGLGVEETKIVGGGAIAAMPDSTATITSTGVLLMSGFAVINDDLSATNRVGILAANEGVVLRRNTFELNDYGIVTVDAAETTIDDNLITQNTATGILIMPGTYARIARNIVTWNGIGVHAGTSDADLGGGVWGSPGGNELSCNTLDLDVGASTSVMANGNRWDHVPPQVGATKDIRLNPNAAVTTDNPALAASPCP